jgi:16S rRNA A1518/A1519 N6-dimethyltransferase RsmA/KsgA/DIM1 with predicted DNA glycosylase/AP lyase activity
VLIVAIVVIIAVVTLLSFSFVLLFGAPFLPTLKKQIDEALDLLDLKPGETMLELGCGDGRVLMAATQRGLSVVGYELNPILVIVAKLRTWPNRRSVTIIWGDYWRLSWPPADGIFGFILPRYMDKLHKKITQYQYRPIKVASFAFEIPNKKPSRVKNGVFLYNYDA